MDLRHLKHFVASARNGSFSAAAHEFNVRQSSVSKRVKQVEDELGGIALFDRSTAGAKLTPAGEEFVDDAERIIQDVDRPGALAKLSRKSLSFATDLCDSRTDCSPPPVGGIVKGTFC